LGKDVKKGSSFLKKRSKKLLRLCLGGAGVSEPNRQKSFASFLQKRRKLRMKYSGQVVPGQP
jgi:hypothetical protein